MKKFINNRQTTFAIYCLFSFLFCSFTLPQREKTIYLTYTQDPTQSITVQWHSPLKDKCSSVLYRKKGTANWNYQTGVSKQIKNYDYLIHKVELIHLESNTEYEFKLENGSIINFFRTLPSTLKDRPITVAIGGDVYTNIVTFQKMNHIVSKQNPDFVILGGDIAYAKGWDFDWIIQRWINFFTEWNSSMRGKGQRMIPVVAAAGNHDRNFSDPNIISEELFFLNFGLHEDLISYKSLDVGSYASFFLLDTNHFQPIEGMQTQWLKDSLLRRAEIPYKFAVYHRPAYPSIYSHKNEISQAIRRNWSPVFESMGIILAFEHHNHAYKRTFPLRDECIDSSGVIYIGDGCWGANHRIADKKWYIDKFKSCTCVNILTLTQDGASFFALSGLNELIDAIDDIQPR